MRKLPKNPTPKPLLEIGRRVLVKATVNFYRARECEEDGFTEKGHLRRLMERTELTEPTEMLVVGARRRILGPIEPSHRSTSFYGEYEYEPGYCDVEETVFVYQVRKGLMRVIEEALPQDVSPVS